ncbi:MAG: leucine--tRNA ligase [Bacteroidota bacterium]
MEYDFTDVERKWRNYWAKNKTYAAKNGSDKPKYYVLDMFPYPSGAGLHVGHPLGYIASDIIARFKRLKGFEVLHPMGYDAFGLPAEQYAIQTGQHPAITTEQNINRYREQLDAIGFSFDWDREVRTSNADFYKWTQWIFIKLFHSWYNKKMDKAEDIKTLITEFESRGNGEVWAACEEVGVFSADDWKKMDEKAQQTLLLNYRMAFLSDTMVNWCPQLGTVLANEEVKDGFSERGGYPVVRKLMKQWSLRISAYADRLLNDLKDLDWSPSIKEIQENWIGKSEGSSLRFKLEGLDEEIEVFTTRPDTIFGATFLTLAPEHELVKKICTADQKDAVNAYVELSKNRSERERMADVKKISGVFTGAYAIHPFSGAKIPVWIGDYVLAGYGTGAVMAVPAHDTRDYAFAKYFNLPIIEVVSGGDISKEAYDAKEGSLVNSDFLNGLDVKAAIKKIIEKIEGKGLGKGKVNYRLRDAIFSRQRYWGEPFPVYYKEGLPYTFDEKDLPLELPEVDAYLPTETGEPPLARAKNWITKDGYPLETNTMPGWAGSSWYYLRYMDATNNGEFVSKDAVNYWQDVDLYIGGAEHATGHLLYVRFWTKFLYDLGLIPAKEPAKKLINQGMILGRSLFLNENTNDGKQISYRIPIEYADDKDRLIIDRFPEVKKMFTNLEMEALPWRTDETGKQFIMLVPEIEKMSKSKYNVVTPDDIITKYGADCLRIYEMFLGPLELPKPWNTNGIEGVSKFIRKFWRLYHDGDNNFQVSDESPTPAELKILHKTIKKTEEDMERFSFNTSVSSFMICVNELTDLKCNKRGILEPLAIILAPYAPHISEELWSLMGNTGTITYARFPEWKEEYIIDQNFEYPISINGKTRTKISLPLNLTKEEISSTILAHDEVIKLMAGKTPKNIIVVPNRIVNIVL